MLARLSIVLDANTTDQNHSSQIIGNLPKEQLHPRATSILKNQEITRELTPSTLLVLHSLVDSDHYQLLVPFITIIEQSLSKQNLLANRD